MIYLPKGRQYFRHRAITSSKHKHHHSCNGMNRGSIIGSPSRWRQSGSNPDCGEGQCLGNGTFLSAIQGQNSFASLMAGVAIGEGLYPLTVASQAQSGADCFVKTVCEVMPSFAWQALLPVDL